MEGSLNTMVKDGWAYDQTRGCWLLDPVQTAGAIMDAEKKASMKARAMVHGYIPQHDETVTISVASVPAAPGVPPSITLKSARCHEFGVGITIAPPHEKDIALPKFYRNALVDRLAKVLPFVERWAQLPQIRRSAKFETVCSCGVAFDHPSDYGRNFHLSAHKSLHPDHVAISAPELGPDVCWYGTGLHKEDVEGDGCISCKSKPGAYGYVLQENSPISMIDVPKCSQLNSHAPGCECATL